MDELKISKSLQILRIFIYLLKQYYINYNFM